MQWVNVVSNADGHGFEPASGKKYVTKVRDLTGHRGVLCGYSGFLPPFKIIHNAANLIIYLEEKTTTTNNNKQSLQTHNKDNNIEDIHIV